MRRGLLAISLATVCGAAYLAHDLGAPSEVRASSAPAVTAATDRQVYFGDLHNHTRYSFDAYTRGARATLDDVYRFAAGESISFMGQQLRRDQALDFIAVTDHAEQMGFGDVIEDSNSLLAKSEIGEKVRLGEYSMSFLQRVLNSVIDDPELKAAGPTAWKRSIEAANRYYRPGKLTTFLAYEWSSYPAGQNLHRNVIFRGDTAPFPFSSNDSQRPEDLWSYLEQNRERGAEALAIPHNANASNGLMYDWVDSAGRAIDEVYAQRRLLNEPLSEIVQVKGQSETHPTLSPEDEFAQFEIFDTLLAGTKDGRKSKPPGSYVRDAYGRGMEIQKRVGTNPYKFGTVGATDMHGGLGTTNESDFGGSTINSTKELVTRAAAAEALGLGDQSKAFWKARVAGSGALTGVWAEANTRESIYTALRRKETFATSGTRLKVRMFAGWNYPGNLLARRDWVHAAYAGGVPMGGDLPTRPRGAKAPAFLIWALKDPNGANLDRAQIVKVWLDGQNRREKIYDVALSGNRRIDPATGKATPVGNTVDLQTATYTNSIGSTQFARVWTDPNFDPSHPAVYYLRVIEIPTPRWTTHLAVRHGLPLPNDTVPTLQERAWSSPIWYTPAGAR